MGRAKKASIRIGERYTTRSASVRVLRRQRGLEWVRVLRNVSRAAREGTCPICTGYCRGRSAGRLRNGVLAFRPAWYPTEPPHVLYSGEPPKHAVWPTDGAENTQAMLSVHVVASPGSHGALEGGGVRYIVSAPEIS